MFKSVKDFLSAANGKRVEKRVTGVVTVETWPEHSAHIMSELQKQGCPLAHIVNDLEGVRVTSTGQFWLKPKLRAYETGVFTVRSADYHFLPDGTDRPVYGDKKGAVIEGSAMIKRYPNGMEVTFQIIE